MDKATRIKVAEEINKHFSREDFFNEEKVKKFKKIAKIGPGGPRQHYDIYALQMGDLTILVWLTPNGHIRVNAQAW